MFSETTEKTHKKGHILDLVFGSLFFEYSENGMFFFPSNWERFKCADIEIGMFYFEYLGFGVFSFE